MKGNYHFDSVCLLYNYLWKTPNNTTWTAASIAEGATKRYEIRLR
jgi:hypothetical protein